MKKYIITSVILFHSLTTSEVSSQNKNLEIPSNIFKAAGLEKLSESEREVLINWIIEEKMDMADIESVNKEKNSSNQFEPVLVDNNTSEPEQKSELFPRVFGGDELISSRIISDFTGWNGRTTFVLENGQTWQQRMDGNYRFTGADTRVTIKRGFMGLYRMELVATGRWIGVRRVD